MQKLAVLASIAVLAFCNTNCGDTGPVNAANGLTPSSIIASTANAADGAGLSTQAKGARSKPGSGSSSLVLAMVTDNANDLPDWGDTVTFNVTTTETAEPHVSLTCSQNGSVVYGAVTGYFATYPWPWTQNMTLSSMSWTAGAADCVAKLYYFSGSRTVNLASTAFVAGA